MIGGSIQDDIFVGGLGGDRMVTMGGSDTVIIHSALESNGSSFHDKTLPESFDTVLAFGNGTVTLEVGRNVSEVIVQLKDKPDAGTADEMFLLLTAAYHEAGGTAQNAVAFRTAPDEYVLLVDDGDGTIDANDVALVIVGSGGFNTDGNGNIVFAPMPD